MKKLRYSLAFSQTPGSLSRDNGKERSGSDGADETRFTSDETRRARCRRRVEAAFLPRDENARVNEEMKGKVAESERTNGNKIHLGKTFRAKPCLFPFMSEVGGEMVVKQRFRIHIVGHAQKSLSRIPSIVGKLGENENPMRKTSARVCILFLHAVRISLYLRQDSLLSLLREGENSENAK